MSTQDEELWQAYDENGEPIPGQGVTKPAAAEGALHAATHVWIWRGEGEETEILLQERHKGAFTWPGYLDISAAGHIDLGETALGAGLRELEEELGFTVSSSQLRLLFVYRDCIATQPRGIIENEFEWVYGLQLSEQTAFSHDSEVDSILWLKLPAFKELIAGQAVEHKIVPHGEVYFNALLRAVEGKDRQPE